MQPRSNVWRYRLDNRTYSMTSYNIFLTGVSNDIEGDLSVAISEKQYEKLRCHIGDEETSEPWTGELPSLAVYDWRGCRMLDKTRWKGKCFTCKWTCMANVTIEYNWGVTQKF